MHEYIKKDVEEKLRNYEKFKQMPNSECAKEWCAIIEATINENLEYKKLVELRYFEGKTAQMVQELLPVSNKTYHKWRLDFIACVAVKAAYKKLLRP